MSEMRFLLLLVQTWFTSIGVSNGIMSRANGTSLRHPHTRTKRQLAGFGGSLAGNITEFPYMVSILIHQQHNCSGGLLTTSFVITSCHCLAVVPVGKRGPAEPQANLSLLAFTFLAGTMLVNDYESTAQVRKPQSIHFHPKCSNELAILYDVGLAKMLTPFLTTPYVQPLKMCSWNKSKFTSRLKTMFKSEYEPECTLAGWGNIESRDSLIGDIDDFDIWDRLKYADMYVLDDEYCLNLYLRWMPETYKDFNFTKYGQLCAASRTMDIFDCISDSGSPYVCEGYIIGVLSNGTRCGRTYPSVIQAVSVLMDWVKEEFAGQIDTSESNFHGFTPSTTLRIPPTPERILCPGNERVDYDYYFEIIPENNRPTVNKSNQQPSALCVSLGLLMGFALQCTR